MTKLGCRSRLNNCDYECYQSKDLSRYNNLLFLFFAMNSGHIFNIWHSWSHEISKCRTASLSPRHESFHRGRVVDCLDSTLVYLYSKYLNYYIKTPDLDIRAGEDIDDSIHCVLSVFVH